MSALIPIYLYHDPPLSPLFYVSRSNLSAIALELTTLLSYSSYLIIYNDSSTLFFTLYFLSLPLSLLSLYALTFIILHLNFNNYLL